MQTTVHTKASGRSAALSLVLVLGAAWPGAGLAGGLSALRRTPGKVTNGMFAPGRPPVDTYGPDASLKCQGGGLADSVQEELATGAKRAHRPIAQPDARVCAVAEAFLGVDTGTKPREAVLAFASHWFGLPAPVQQVVIAQIDSDDPRLIAERILEPLGAFAANADFPRYGIATSVTKRGQLTQTKISIATFDAAVEVDAFPRRMAPGQQATLSGRLLDDVTNAKVSVVDPGGQLSVPQQAPGKEFKVDVKCGDRAGEIRVEVRGSQAEQSIPVANFPVACGTALPTSVALAAPPWPTEAAPAERKILDQTNVARADAGAKPLAWDDALAQVARGIAESLHGGGTGSDVGERLKAAGISSPLIVQNLAADRTPERVYERTSASPTNRANALNADVTNVGIGLFQTTDSQNRPLVYLAEIFIKELPPVDVAAVRASLRDAVTQKRKDARAGAVTSDPVLEDVAERYAQALAAGGGTLSKDDAAKITAPLNSPFRTVSLVAGAKQDPLDFAEEPQIVAAGKVLGVGVAQGKNPTLGRNAVYVALMIGMPRGEPVVKPAKAGKATRPKK